MSNLEQGFLFAREGIVMKQPPLMHPSMLKSVLVNDVRVAFRFSFFFE